MWKIPKRVSEEINFTEINPSNLKDEMIARIEATIHASLTREMSVVFLLKAFVTMCFLDCLIFLFRSSWWFIHQF